MSYTNIFDSAFGHGGSGEQQLQSTSGNGNARFSTFAAVQPFSNSTPTRHPGATTVLHATSPTGTGVGLSTSASPRVGSGTHIPALPTGHPAAAAQTPATLARAMTASPYLQRTFDSAAAAASNAVALRSPIPASASAAFTRRRASPTTPTSPRQNKSSMLSYQHSRERMREQATRAAINRGRDVGAHADPANVLGPAAIATPEAATAVTAKHNSLYRGTESIGAKYSQQHAATTTPAQRTPNRGPSKKLRKLHDDEKAPFRVTADTHSAATLLAAPPPPVRPQVEAVASQVREALHKLTATMGALNGRLVELTQTQWELQIASDRLRNDIREVESERDEISVKLNSMCSSMGSSLAALIAEAEDKQRHLQAARDENSRLRQRLQLQ